MELRDYLKIFSRQKPLIIIFTLLVTIGAFLFAYNQPILYDTSISFTINRTAKQQTADYQYDGYYAMQASNLLANTIMSWLMTPSVLLEIYQQAGIKPQIKSIDQFSNQFKVKKFSAQNVVVRFKERNQETAEKIAHGVITVVQNKAQELNKTSKGESLFTVVGSLPVIVPFKASVALVTLIGLICGLLVGCLLAYIRWYFRQ